MADSPSGSWSRPGASTTPICCFAAAPRKYAIYPFKMRPRWQRGSNKNTNGLLRQYFSQGSESSVHWGNLFCVGHAGGSPTKSVAFEAVKSLSARLPRAQIEAVDPDIIFFTTGHCYDAFLRDCFPDRHASNPIKAKCLWEFRLGRALCYRTSHPRYAAHNPWQDKAIRLAFAGGAAAYLAQQVEWHAGDRHPRSPACF